MCSYALLRWVADNAEDSLLGENLYTFINPYSYTVLRKNPSLCEDLDGVGVGVGVDGQLLVLLLRLFHIKTVSRASFDMTSLAPVVFDYASQENKTLYFVGSKQDEIDSAINKIKASYPAIEIPRYRNGYFSGEEREQELARLVEEAPDIVVVGMGTPLQEQFLIDLRSRGWKGTGFTCGGFLHQTAKGIQYYPKWMDKLNLRWLYRIYDEPKLFKRYTVDYSKFVFLFLYDVARYRLSKS